MISMSRFIDFIGFDGVLHIVFSFAIVFILHLFLPGWLSVVLTFIVGVLKEVYDEFLKEGGFFDVKDLLCDSIGIALYAISNAIVNLF